MYLRLVINGNQVKRSKMRGLAICQALIKIRSAVLRPYPHSHHHPYFSCPSSCSVNLFVGWLQRASGSLTTAKAN